MQGHLFPVETNWHPPAEFPTLSGLVGIDTETNDEGLNRGLGPGWVNRLGKVVGISVSSEQFTGYFPIAHQGGGNLDRAMVLRWIDDQFRNPDITWVFANCKYDIGWLLAEGVRYPAGKVWDVQIMAPLLDEYRLSYSLDNLAKDYLGKRKDEKLLRQAVRDFGFKDAKRDLWRLPAPFAGPYAEEDAMLARQLALTLYPKLEAEELLEAYALECGLVPLLIKMRQNGIRVDESRVGAEIKRLQAAEIGSLQEIHKLSGIPVDPWDANSIGTALATEGIICPRTAQGQPSVTKFLLAQWSEAGSKIAPLVRAARRYQKTRSTFLEGHILGHLQNGKVHCELHPLRSDDGGAVTFRFSCSDPALQQIPSPERGDAEDKAMGSLVRKCFLPNEGQLWAANDYSSQEPRMTTHFANISGCPGGAEAAAEYNRNPKLDFHQYMSEITGRPRKQAKDLFLGMCYGMGGAKLCKALGLPTVWKEKDWGGGGSWEVAGPEGQAIIDQFNERAPFVSKVQELCKNRAKNRGFIKLLKGYRCHFPYYKGNQRLTEWEVGAERWFVKDALNKLIQGSSAVQTKASMVALYESEGVIPLLQMHDELDFSVDHIGQAQKYSEIMCNTVRLSVPTVVDIEIGPSWGEYK